MQPAESASVRRPSEGRLIAVVGDVYRFLATGAETGGRYATWEAIVPPGGGPPPHTHTREEESFYILEGEMTFTVDGQSITAPAGTFVRVPIGTLHNFHNGSDQVVRMTITVVPAGIEQMFFEVGQPVTPGHQPGPPTKEEIEKLLATAPNYGIRIVLPPH
jgi:quercetin dioxygenase-like cupin family protein